MFQLLRDYLNLGSVATVAAVVGIGTSLYSANQQYEHGDDHGGGPAPSGGNVGTADDAWQQILQRMMQQYGSSSETLAPYLSDSFDSARGELPGIQERMRALANMFMGEGQGLFGAGHDLRGAGADIWTAARDPQNALHDRTQQRIVDASRAATSARGIGMSGESAGIENQAVGNFNIDWESGMLDRLLKGGQGMAGMFNEAGRNTQAGAGLMSGGVDLNTRATGLPFNLASLYSSGLGSAIYGPGSAIMGQIDPYIGLGQSGQQNAFTQGQVNMNNLTSGLTAFSQSPGYGWLSNFFSGGATPSGGGYYSGGSAGDPGGNWSSPG